ncbi:MAG: sigma 54-interacting transcriptional regulator [Polyangiaceae bacterium]
MPDETDSQSWETEAAAAPEPVPGVVLVFSGVQSHFAAAPVRSQPLLLGRDGVLGLALGDTCLSRRHAEVSFEGGRFRVRDLDSRNGTFLDGERVRGERTATEGVLRVGDTMLLLRRDVRLFLGGTVERVDDVVIGPTLRPIWRALSDAATQGGCVHIRGETGTGKELAARHFHFASGRGKRPFVDVNCATIPHALAERLLFGARKGAYSGAEADAEGYFQAANGGTLFLDEVADLDLAVQAKLLRVLEQRQILPLGATKPIAVDVRLCSAAHRDLAEEVARGRFRDDLYYRLALPAVVIPPLRERYEDVPWLMQAIAARTPGELSCHASVVEAVLLRPWPGNARELEKRIVEAAATAHAQGDRQIRASHLAPSAGRANQVSERPAASAPAAVRGALTTDAPEPPLSRDAIERALAETGGNISAAAVALGLHRTELRRLMVRLKIRRTGPEQS